MIKTIAIVIIVALAAVVIFAATKPDTFRVQRATSIKAPPEKIFALINDFQVMQVFFDMDDMVGKDFETGLANLKAVAEKKAADARVTPFSFSNNSPTTEVL